MTRADGKKRVLIAAGSYADAASAIRLAEGFASRLIAGLGGLLVEDDAIMDAAGLPVQRVVTTSGMLVETPSRRRFEGLMESDARAFRSGLSNMAAACAVDWVFDRRRGDLVAGVCQAAGGWDMLIVGQRTDRRIGRVVLIDHAQSPSQDAAAVARQVAEFLATDLVMISTSGPDAAQAGPGAGASEIRSEAELLARINRINAALVVVDLATGPLQGSEQLRQLLEVSRCPVLVFNAALAR